MTDTIDEYIYGKTDWDNLLGAQRNRYFILNDQGKLQEQQEPPRTPLPRENELTPEMLTIGGEYPGVYEGTEHTCDSDGNVFTASGDLIKNPQGVPELIRKTRGSYGRFKVTPNRLYVLVQAFEQEEWLIKFAGQLQERFEQAPRPETDQEQTIEINELKLGDPFPAKLVPQDALPIYLRQNRGRMVLAKKEGRGWRFARLGDQAADPNQGQDGQNLLQAAVEYKKSYPQLSKLLLTKEGHAVVLREGEYKYIATLHTGLEFP